MNTLKPLLFVAVLAGIGYGVYVRINDGNDAPPPGVPEGWDNAPKVQLPEAAAPGVAGGLAAWGPGGGPSTAGTISQPFATAGAPPAPIVQPAASDAPQFPSAGAGAPSVGASISVGANSATPGFNPPPSSAGLPPSPGVQTPPIDVPRSPGVADAPPYPGANPAMPVANNAPPVDYANDRYRTPPEASAGPGGASALTAALDAAQRELEAGQMASALQQLSAWQDDPRLSPSEQHQLMTLLDQVAGTVVYSTQHLLEPPYEVQPGERLEDIAQRYNVPWPLLAKINGIEDPQSLRPGERLKVVRGPFSAVISLEKKQLTILLNGAYAGRFAIGIGREKPPREGTFAVSDKVIDPVYHGTSQGIAAHDRNNPLGERWIGLGTEVAIHGTNAPENIGRTDLPGSISLSARDVEDVYDILSVGSKVVIRR